MCRIAGTITENLNGDERRKRVRTMCNVLQHGGPDDEGVQVFDDVSMVLGHRRLSIIDLSDSGHQPMWAANNNACITFNGEIYNYLELKAELLSKGATFKSDTDTEVILQAYLYWGISGFEKLRGMFAFALYDSEKALTYLVRDSSGIKPLYYYARGGELTFASEVRALQRAGVTTQTNKSWLIRFLAFGHVPEPETTLDGVFSLAKGTFLCWNHHTRSYVINSYVQPRFTNEISNVTEARQLIAASLKAAVKRQLIADAPIGVFLSGGIDSSLITLLAGEEKQQSLKTVSLFFNEKQYDEQAYQQLVASKVKGENFSHLIRQADFQRFFPDILNAMDMPTTDGINSWFISKYAHDDGLKTVLSGLGGDELFGGYPSFNRIQYIAHLRKIAPSFLKAVSKYASDRYKKITYLTYQNHLADYLFLRGLFTVTDIAAILDCSEQQVCDVLFMPNIPLQFDGYHKQQAAWFETNLYMQNQLLHDTDVMSMSHGLEVRVPFLDEDFQAVVNNIAPEIRFDKKTGKKILIEAFKEILPNEVWNRRKMGFSFPLQDWMRMDNAIVNEGRYNAYGNSLIKKFKNNQLHWSKAFALYQVSHHA